MEICLAYSYSWKRFSYLNTDHPHELSRKPTPQHGQVWEAVLYQMWTVPKQPSNLTTCFCCDVCKYINLEREGDTGDIYLHTCNFNSFHSYHTSYMFVHV